MKHFIILFIVLSLSGCLLYRTDNCELTFFKPHYMDRERTVTKEDIAILKKTIEILGDETQWNKKDDRLCFYEERWSLYCALAKATVDVTGKYKHRRVAMQEIMFTINDNFSDRWQVHQLMDFNNHKSTSYKDIKWVLEQTIMRLEKRYQSKK